MRSTTTHRRMRARPPAGLDLAEIARLVDQAMADDPDHVAVHVAPDGDELVLGVLPIEVGTHPFTVLAGLVAPPAWSVFGLRVRGTAHFFDERADAPGASTTFLVDRSGADMSIMRLDGEAVELRERAVGILPDACRRVLGLPTAPAPRSTAILWSVAWLDRLVEAWGDPARRSGLTPSFLEVTALHPAPGSAVLDSDELVRIGRAHADEWPWARLRGEPQVLDLPGGGVPADVAAWMDDGFFARWVLGAFPPAPVLVHDLAGLLDPDVRLQLLTALAGLLDA